MGNTLYTLTGKVQTELLEPVTGKIVIFYYVGEEVARVSLDEDGYFSYNNDKLQGLYDDSDLPKKLRTMIEKTKIVNTEITKTSTPTFDNKEVRAIKINVIVRVNQNSANIKNKKI